ncbi:PREDICTED: uncharacterized protein LOC109215732 [Nicotiana attenuata]|uniref:Uncharacterized protein n=1 Tax=Nicotiana attenuata TaxID=49451 RepID=A0A1J6KBK8_NICAT|nr:PREDICTED: uncharacterized protein LOC109215732 [Nicotiana attenuata]XP_019235395.1 PREDICTED: uncharacterized protein LOC109215732 [Nicotiana attenuata]OIT26076.1 hypothetical protein A4A49_29089 [Nicotiana attenuata]
MGFFDLNIPYYESDRNITNKTALKATRLKLTIKAMELGYTGIAYNRTIKGVMSESDRCSISLFPVSSIVKLAPSLASSVEFRRKLLNVPVSSPFRQYTRLTVMVDSSAQASALNSGNPILKTYDVVAVRPLNQLALEQACQVSEVDIIAIDFSEKLPFRLKQSMVKAAIQRGVYFEMTYSSLILDSQMRRQMISNAKLLVDWTRGKNLLFSSAAPSVTELRGPYDVANLASLLGLQLERAKAAVSKNCRTVLTNAFRKRCYHKETIKVELITSGAKKPEFDDWLIWDPISSGEGDLLLDDIKKSFSVSSNVSKNVKRIDFSSVVNNLPSHGLQIKDLISTTELGQEPLDTIAELAGVKEDEMALPTSGISERPGGVNFPPEECSPVGGDLQKIHQASSSEEVKVPCLFIAPLNDADNLEIEKESDRIDEDMKCTEKLDIKDTSGTKIHDFQTGTSTARCEGYILMPDSATIRACRNDIEVKEIIMIENDEMKITNNLDMQDTSSENKVHDLQPGTFSASGEGYAVLPESAANYTCRRDTEVTLSVDSSLADIFTLSKDGTSTGSSGQHLGTFDSFHTDFRDQNGAFGGVSLEAQLNNKSTEKEQSREMRYHSATLADGSYNNELNNSMEVDNENLVVDNLPVKDVSEEELKHTGNNIGLSYQIMGGSLSGNMKRKTSYRPSLFPFKRLLSHRASKWKAQRLNQFTTL